MKRLLILFNLIFLPIISSDSDIAGLIKDHCPILYSLQQSCSNYSSEFKQKQSQFQNSSIFKALNSIKTKKTNYENLQKASLDCRNQASTGCKDKAQKVVSALSDMYKAIQAVMDLIHNNPNFVSKMPKANIVPDSIVGINYQKISNYDKDSFNKILSDYLDDPSFDDSALDLLDQITIANDQYKSLFDDFNKCMDGFSQQCDSKTKDAYDALTDLNNTIFQIMQDLYNINPSWLDKPVTQQVKVEALKNYNYTNLPNFNSDKFTAAISKYRDSIIPPNLISNLVKCKNSLNTYSSDCQAKIIQYADKQKSEEIPKVALELAAGLAEFEAVEGVLVLFEVQPELIPLAAIGITMIPQIVDLTTKAADWVVDGLFGLLSPDADDQFPLPHIFLQDVVMNKIQLKKVQIGKIKQSSTVKISDVSAAGTVSIPTTTASEGQLQVSQVPEQKKVSPPKKVQTRKINI